MNIEDLKNIDDINFEMLPPIMAEEYNKLKFQFDIEFDGMYFPREVFNAFYAEVTPEAENDKLHKINLFNSNITNSLEDYGDGFWDAFYKDNLLAGITTEEDQIFEIFSRIYKKLPSILNPGISTFKRNINVYNGLDFIKKHLYDYGFDVGTFIKAWQIILNNIPHFEDIFIKHFPEKIKVNNNNPYPEIFIGEDDEAFKLFHDFAQEATDYYLDFSFIFQKMKNDNLIKTDYPHLKFMKWLFENKYIAESTYSEFKDKESFTTKADRGMRSTRYYKMKERYFLPDSNKSEKTSIDRK